MKQLTLRLIKGLVATAVLTAPVAGICGWTNGQDVTADVTVKSPVTLSLASIQFAERPVSTMTSGIDLGAVEATVAGAVPYLYAWKWDDADRDPVTPHHAFFSKTDEPDLKYRVTMTFPNGLSQPTGSSWFADALDGNPDPIKRVGIRLVDNATNLPAGVYKATIWAGIYL